VVLVSEKAHVDAIVAALNAGNPSANAYTRDALKELETLPEDYTEVSVSRRFGGTSRLGPGPGPELYRVTTRAVGRFEDNAREMRKRAKANLEFVSVTVGSGTTTPVQFESELEIEDDQGFWSGWTYWTYAL
jgi:hypothetical protein